jgi:hypothetical protein
MFEAREGTRTDRLRPPPRALALARRAGMLLRREGVRVVVSILSLVVALELLGALAGFGTPVFLAAEAIAVALVLLL